MVVELDEPERNSKTQVVEAVTVVGVVVITVVDRQAAG